MKRSTKRLALLLALLQLTLLLVTSCGEHVHEFKETYRKDPTCLEAGYVKSVCSCGEEKTETLEATGHNMEVTSNKEPTCTNAGFCIRTCSVCGVTENEEYDPLGHDLTGDDDDYFSLRRCTHEGCTYVEHNESDKPFQQTFETGYTEELKADVQKLIDDVNAFLKANNGPYEELDKLILELEETMGLMDQAVNRTQLEFYMEPSKQDTYTEASAFQSDIYAKYRKICLKTYDSKYRDQAFEGWDEDELNDFISECRALDDPKYVKLQNRADEIIAEARQMAQSDSRVGTLLVELADINNQMAKYHGYDNYYEYAFSNVFGRQYDIKKIEYFSDYIDQYVLPLYQSISESAEKLASSTSYPLCKVHYSALMESSMFENDIAYSAVNDYIAQMDLGSVGDRDPLNMLDVAKDLFREGNYFFGKTDAAFTMPEPYGTPLLYFKNDASYANSFTFIHEFGHYTNAVYNPMFDTDMDIAETHSQGNEMMFSLFLEDWLKGRGKSDTDAYQLEKLAKYMSAEKVADMLFTSIICDYVDCFEYALYTGQITGTNYKSWIQTNISAPYASYILYVSTISPCYYISYALSAIPSVKLYAIAKEQGLDKAKECYYGLLDYMYHVGELNEEDDGTLTSDATFEDALVYAGIGSPFEEQFYKDLAEALDPEKE